MLKKLLGLRFVRFASVGMLNTAVNFVVLNLAFYVLGLPEISSSILATSIAIIFSFFMNRIYVFMDVHKPKQKFVKFAILTMTGVMIIQNAVFALLVTLLDERKLSMRYLSHVVGDVFSFNLPRNFLLINLSNLVASLCVMIWNYNTYRILVFNGGGREDENIEETKIL